MLLALVIAVFLWVVAQGSTSIRYSFDIPVEIHGVPEDLVVTNQTANEINVGVTGSRAALRNLDESRLKYAIDVSNAKAGVAEYEVELARIELPRRAKFVGHSPSRVQVRLELQSRKEVAVEADVQGAPAPGYELTEVRVVPDRVWLAGARSQVVRLAEVPTEPIDVTNLTESVEKQVRLILGGGTVWMEDEKPVTIQLVVEPIPVLDPAQALTPGPDLGLGLDAAPVDPVVPVIVTRRAPKPAPRAAPPVRTTPVSAALNASPGTNAGSGAPGASGASEKSSSSEGSGSSDSSGGSESGGAPGGSGTAPEARAEPEAVQPGEGSVQQ